MKQLLVMRHAKSDKSNPDLKDIERPLNKRGKEDRLLMRDELQKLDLLPEIMLCSNAIRGKETMEAFLELPGLERSGLYYDSFYREGAEAIMKAIQDLPAYFYRTMVIGHNPDMEMIVSKVLNVNEDYVKMPTAAVALIVCNNERWSEFDLEKSRLQWIITPKDVKNSKIK